MPKACILKVTTDIPTYIDFDAVLLQKDSA